MNSQFLFNPENISFKLQTLAEPRFAWFGFAVIVGIFALMSAILLYHWISYGYKPLKMSIPVALYFFVSLLLIASISISLTAYTAAV